MDIDKLFQVVCSCVTFITQLMVFQVPRFSVSGNKRKMFDKPAPEMLKKIKLDRESIDVNDSSAGGRSPATMSRKATVDNAKDEDSELDFAPGGDADYFVEEDDEGRFFGGGLSSEQKDILNIFDQAGSEGVDEVSHFVQLLLHVPHYGQVEALSINRIRKLLLAFEHAVNKNQNQRSKYPEDPSKCVKH